METEQHGDPDKINKANLKQARRTAAVFAILTSFSLICLVYAYVQQGIAKETNRENEALNMKLSQCEKAAFEQLKLSQKTALELEERFRRMGESSKRNSKK